MNDHSRHVSAFAPASMGNLSVGFDLLGAALSPIDPCAPLGDVVSVSAGEGIQLNCRGRYASFLPATNNIVVRCAERFLAQFAPQCQGLTLTLDKNLPIGSGLGSSASSVVAALAALNRYFDEPLTATELLQLMGELEGEISGSVHFDNVAPSFLGGLQLMQANGAQAIPSFDHWYWVVAYPGSTLSTAAMRALLPVQVDLSTAIAFGQHLATFVAASFRHDETTALAALTDVLAEPYRAAHIPNYHAARQHLKALGFDAVGISGSGPTLFAVCRDEACARQGQAYLEQQYVTNQYGLVRICRLASQGVIYEESIAHAVN